VSHTSQFLQRARKSVPGIGMAFVIAELVRITHDLQYVADTLVIRVVTVDESGKPE
jgi:hypothetical protein